MKLLKNFGTYTHLVYIVVFLAASLNVLYPIQASVTTSIRVANLPIFDVVLIPNCKHYK